MPEGVSPSEPAPSTHVTRAEALLSRWGQSVESARQKAALNSGETPAGEPSPIAPNGVSADDRAEALLTQAGEALGRWSSEAYLQLRRATALAREEAEDIWAEAQALRADGAALPVPADAVSPE